MLARQFRYAGQVTQVLACGGTGSCCCTHMALALPADPGGPGSATRSTKEHVHCVALAAKALTNICRS